MSDFVGNAKCIQRGENNGFENVHSETTLGIDLGHGMKMWS